MKADAPRVTVLMPVYNAEATLREAVDSILAQTLADFEFVIVDDGSTDGSIAIVQSYADERIRLLCNPNNLRLAQSLNRGLAAAQGEYIARMDADDVSLPERLAQQVAFMDAHPDIGISGTWAETFGEARYAIRHPHAPAFAKSRLLFNTTLAHPTVIMRRGLMEAFGLKYRDFYPCDDYELWQRAADFFPLSNLPKALLRYRVTGQSAFHGTSQSTYREIYRQIDSENLQRLGLTTTEAQLATHNRLRNPAGVLDSAPEEWLLSLRLANQQTGYYQAEALDEVLRERWCLFCYVTQGWGPRKYLRYLCSPLSRIGTLSLLGQLKIFLKFCVWKLFTVVRAVG